MDRTEALALLEKTKLYIPVQVPVSLLEPVDYNPRDIDTEEMNALIASIDEDPDFMKARPVIVNTYEGREFKIIAGQRRWEAHQKMDKVAIWTIFVNVDPNKEKEWNIKDNNHAGRWNDAKLKDVLINLHTEQYPLTSLGFTPTALTDHMYGSELAPANPKDDPDYKGSTPGKKGKVAVGAKIECPECGHSWQYMASSEPSNDGATMDE